MTVIVGIVRDGKVTIAGDRLGSDGFCKVHVMEPKVFKVGDFIFGCTSSFRMIDILKYAFTPPPRTVGSDTQKYLRHDFINAMRNTFVQNGFGIVSGGDWKGGNLLIGYEGRLYRIESDFLLLETPYDAQGSGSYHAVGALTALLDLSPDMPEKELLTRAIKSSYHHVISVGGDIDFESA